jgi:hypothetical protein
MRALPEDAVCWPAFCALRDQPTAKSVERASCGFCPVAAWSMGASKERVAEARLGAGKWKGFFRNE